MELRDRFKLIGRALNFATVPGATSLGDYIPESGVDATTDDREDQPKTPIYGEIAVSNALERLFADPNKVWVRFNPSALVRRKSIEIYSQMARDDQVKAALMFKRYAVMSTGWEVFAPDGVTDKKWEPMVECKRQFEELDSTMEHSIDEILSAGTYGFSVTEKVWKEGAKFVELDDLKTRHPFAIDFSQDAFGNIANIRQMTNAMPIEKFVVYVNNGKFNNPYGESDIEAAYRAWWIKDNAYKWMAMLLERMGIPPIFALYNSNSMSGQINDLKKVMSSLQSATYGAIPRPSKDDLEFWSPQLADNVAKIFIPALQQFNEDIARAVLLPGLLGFTPDSGAGSRARSAISFDAFLIVINRMRKFTEIQINRSVVRDICDINWPQATFDKGYPRFGFLPLSDEVKDNLFTLWMEAVAGNVVTTGTNDEAHIRAALKFPEEAGAPLPEKPAPAGDGTVPGPKLGPAPPEQKEFAVKDLQPDEAKAKKAMDAAEANIIKGAKAALATARDVLLATVRKQQKMDIRFIDTINLRKMGDVRAAFEEGMRAALEAGRSAIHYSAIGTWKEYDFTPQEALAYLRQKAVQVADDIDGNLSAAVKRILLDAIKNGEPLGDTIIKLNQAFNVYAGDSETPDKPGRLETIVRTNVTDAYNQGRLNQAIDPEVAPFMFGVKFSAILDERTTPVCNLLGTGGPEGRGVIFRIDDPELLRLIPPLHFNCRSIIVPITKASAKTQGLTSADYVSKITTAAAAEMINKTGFYSVMKPCGCGEEHAA